MIFSQFSQITSIIDESGNKYTHNDLQTENDNLIIVIGRRALIFSLCSNEKGSLLGCVTFINNGILPVLFDAWLDLDMLNNSLINYRPDYLWLPCYIADIFGYKRVYSACNYVLLKTGNVHVFLLELNKC